MSKRDRGHFFATVTVLFLGFVLCAAPISIWQLSAAYTQHRVEAERYTAYYAADAQERIEQECSVLEGSALTECISEVISSTHEQRRAEADLNAQRDMANWAWGALIVATAGVGITGVGVVYVALTLAEARRTTAAAVDAAEAAKDTIEVTRDIGEAQVRAYLKIIDCGGYLFQNNGDDGIAVFVEVKNFGQSPARDLHFILEFPCNIDAGDGWMTTKSFYSREWMLGDIATGDTINSGFIHFNDLGLPPSAIRDGQGKLLVRLGRVGLFAADVFNREIFESQPVMISEDLTSHDSFRQVGGRFPFMGSEMFHDDEIMKRGWSSYRFNRGKPKRKPQDHA